MIVPRQPEAFVVQCWRSGRSRSSRSLKLISRSSRSLKLLVFATVTYIISIQFKSSLRTLESPASQYGYSTVEPPGRRRWESNRNQSRDQRWDSIDMDASEVNKETKKTEELLPKNESGGPKGILPEGKEKVQQKNETSNNLRQDSASQHDDNDDSRRYRQTLPLRRSPRIIALQYAIGGLSVMRLNDSSQSTAFKNCSMPEDGPEIEQSWYEPNAKEFVDGYDMSVCELMYDWQLKSYPNCNSFHELDLLHMRVINTGGSRIAFELRQQLEGGEEAKFVYKSVKYTKDVNRKQVEKQRKDSIVLERTTASQFTPDIHGYCSLGVMMDFMPEGNMHDYIKGVRLAGGSTLSPVDRLRLGIHIATGVADLHTIDGTPIPSIFHNDLCCHQYLFQNGTFKLNDFDHAKPICINKKTNEQCTRTRFGMSMWKARSLEEHQQALGSPDFWPVKPDKIDVWMMGNLIYYMLTDLYTFEKPINLSSKDSGRELIEGRRTPYPEHIEKSKDLSHVAMKKALDMCWTQKSEERPSARSISNYMIGQLKAITGEENPDVRVVLPERDHNQRNTESDYDEYND